MSEKTAQVTNVVINVSAQMSEVAVISPLEEMRVGDTYVLDDLPLHLTVLPNARFDSPSMRCVEEVRRIATSFRPFVAGALRFEMFGPNRDIPVTEIRVVRELRQLHEELRDAVRKVGGVAVEPAYWGAGYRAHVTKTQRHRSIEPGDEVWIDRLALIDCTEPVRRVVSVEPLDSPVGESY